MGEKSDPRIAAAVTEPGVSGCEGSSGEAGDVVLLSLPSKPEYVGLSRLAVAGLAGVPRLPEESVADLKLAVTEACTFALQHAAEHSDALLVVAFRLIPGTWVIEVTWPAINRLGDVPPADGGLGLAVMRALVDEVDLEPSPDGRALLRLTKRL